MTEPDPLLPFARRQRAVAALRPPAWLVALVAAAVVGGAAGGATLSSGAAAPRALRAIFFGSALGYLVLSLLDFWEHFRLEKAATGRYRSMTVVPPGETLNHAATGALLVAMFVLARPLPPVLAARDWLVLLTPAVFLVLGWRDEMVYHRRRCAHREDIMHTVAHLAAGVMMCSYLSSRLWAW